MWIQTKKALGKLAAVLVAAATATAVATAPASAAPQSEDPHRSPRSGCEVISGKSDLDVANDITMCLGYNWARDTQLFQFVSQVRIGAGATSATACKITAWAVLSDANSQWASAKNTQSCNASLWDRDSYYQQFHGKTGTSATHMVIRGCIDLYYNGSPHSGWQRCWNTPRERILR